MGDAVCRKEFHPWRVRPAVMCSVYRDVSLGAQAVCGLSPVGFQSGWDWGWCVLLVGDVAGDLGRDKPNTAAAAAAILPAHYLIWLYCLPRHGKTC